MDKDFPKRKNIRLKEYDYDSAGAYFITICTKNRKPILSKIESVGAGVLDRPYLLSLPHPPAAGARSPRSGPPFVGCADIFPRYRGKSAFTQGRHADFVG